MRGGMSEIKENMWSVQLGALPKWLRNTLVALVIVVVASVAMNLWVIIALRGSIFSPYFQLVLPEPSKITNFNNTIAIIKNNDEMLLNRLRDLQGTYKEQLDKADKTAIEGAKSSGDIRVETHLTELAQIERKQADSTFSEIQKIYTQILDNQNALLKQAARE